MGTFIDLTGRQFGMLTVISRSKNDKNGKVQWVCRCDCGRDAIVRSSDLKRGSTNSCGCLQKKAAAAQAQRNVKHGMTGSRIYNIWLVMNARCYNKSHISFESYGGRGIGVCDEWRNDPEAFRDWALANGYQDDLTIERKDTGGNYEPSNCCWATKKDQANNRRNNRLVSCGGMTHTISEWSLITGIRSDTIRRRLDAGWTVDKALYTPPR